MIPALLSTLFGALIFVNHPLDGISVSPVNPFTGASQCDWIACDLNDDKAQDWLTPTGVYLQHEGTFNRDHFIAYSDTPASATLDVWEGTVFFWGDAELVRMKVENGAWAVASRQALAKPAPPTTSTRENQITLSRFLFDLDANKTPELVAVAEDGVHLFSNGMGDYQVSGVFDVLPPMRLLPIANAALSPPDARLIQIPQRYRFARLWVESSAINVLTWENPEAERRNFTLKTWPLVAQDMGDFALGEAVSATTAPLPPSAMPCRLNTDGTLDFAGFDIATAKGAALPQPILQSWACLDFGTSTHTRRSAATFRFRQHTQFVDFEGDGDLDFVTESPDLFQHGLRETLGHFTSRKKINHAIEIFLQAKNTYSDTPAVSHTVTVEFSVPPIQAPPDYEAWLAGKRVNLSGDFNTDGYRDLVVREEMDTLSIYLAEGFAFPGKASIQLNIDPGFHFEVFDINGDKRSDIIVAPPQGSQNASPPIVHYAREQRR